ncbi:leukocyte receptor cluster member 1 [Apteryx mantelli]|uniref:Leukocyte receptor cluster member 1 n=1 Tax=Apteryx mantelli TaxID=2696672 RepID=A0ABM4FZR8_9AVES
MNILPKKSWHVRNKDNVARVRRDEAEAEAERRKREARALLAEQEARTQLLRKKARGGPGPPDCTALVPGGPGHLELFPSPAEAGGTPAPNKEHEEEKRQEQERREQALGLLTYLGQSAAEAQTCPPWYQRAPEAAAAEVAERDEGQKAKLDPLREMEKQLRKKGARREREQRRQRERRPESRAAGPPSLEELRRERLQREEAERARTRALLAGPREPPAAAATPPADDRTRPYNSQFNPHLARQRRGPPKPR